MTIQKRLVATAATLMDCGARMNDDVGRIPAQMEEKNPEFKGYKEPEKTTISVEGKINGKTVVFTQQIYTDEMWSATRALTHKVRNMEKRINIGA